MSPTSASFTYKTASPRSFISAGCGGFSVVGAMCVMIGDSVIAVNVGGGETAPTFAAVVGGHGGGGGGGAPICTADVGEP